MAELTCPKCQAPMRSYERSGVTVDRCTECGGVFLDRGELERLIDAEAQFNQRQGWSRREEAPYERGYDDEDYRRRRRGGFLGGLFGGDD
ncbi:zf-TFIIB domain-containing protein [Candidatus Nephthysia bennettiae]|uniref:Zf-TFIIB domain-containing protein n=1 Tax=Candidatus Nephthysia bennettiae TaxID=3127016 RepID=A0A934N7S5_9BACT|nr:zf-TFIIB domain-containing protein [Candidatus Dormibacteraeota bacterium]MBJ7607133.1 zf-TFIIB domain-containing protein [Candidatus Dormibacteraeota bacterium]MBJ7613678.1 zf-TFIIB domain-containing protein [Candidatus Dormibacteraeota bacterium]